MGSGQSKKHNVSGDGKAQTPPAKEQPPASVEPETTSTETSKEATQKAAPAEATPDTSPQGDQQTAQDTTRGERASDMEEQDVVRAVVGKASDFGDNE